MTPYLPLPDIIRDIALLLMISAVVVPFARWLGIGPELGLLLSGIILGSEHLVGSAQVGRLREISELGVVFFLFAIGLELDVRKTWSLRRYAFGLGSVQVMATGLVMMFYWHLFTSAWPLAFLLGLVLAQSSTALVLRLLEAKGELGQDHGQAAFAVLLFQDLTVVPIMALVPVLAGTGAAGEFSWWDIGSAVGMLALIFVIGRYLCPRLFTLAAGPNRSEAFTAVIFIAILGSAWLAHRVGLSMALGAFLMGVALSSTEYQSRLEEEIRTFKNFLLGVFFVSMGLTIDLGVLGEHGLRIALHVIAILAVKILVVYLAARALQMPHASAARASFLLAQAGEFGFVILGALRVSGVLTATQFSLGLMVIALTMIMTPWLDAVGVRWSRWSGIQARAQGSRN